MKYVEAKLPTDLEYVDLYAVSDIHRGHRQFNEKAWSILLDNIANDPHAYMVLNGDLVEAALKSSKFGETYHTMAPKEERKLVAKELERVRDKIVGITAGNHDMRATKDSDECPVELIAEHLGLLDKYDPEAIFLDVQFGKRHGSDNRHTSFVFYVTHGSGGGRRPGGKANRIQEMGLIADGCDGYILGHVHSLMSFIEERLYPDTRNKCTSIRPVAHVIAGSMLNYGGYAQVGMYPPNAVSMPILRMYAKKSADKHKHMDVVLPTKIRNRVG